MTKPTYTAAEIKNLAMTINDPEGMKVLATLINEEIELYNDDELVFVAQASMIIFVRSLIVCSIKMLP